jgi:hypothetical protein
MRGLNTLEKRRTAILQMACKRAVKGGERLPRVEIEDLVRRATESSVTPTAPMDGPGDRNHAPGLDKRFKPHPIARRRLSCGQASPDRTCRAYGQR